MNRLGLYLPAVMCAVLFFNPMDLSIQDQISCLIAIVACTLHYGIVIILGMGDIIDRQNEKKDKEIDNLAKKLYHIEVEIIKQREIR